MAPERLPVCLPGEPRACGQDARSHVLGWAAELKAAAHHLIETSAASEDQAVYFAGQFYRERLEAMRGPA